MCEKGTGAKPGDHQAHPAAKNTKINAAWNADEVAANIAINPRLVNDIGTFCGTEMRGPLTCGNRIWLILVVVAVRGIFPSRIRSFHRRPRFPSFVQWSGAVLTEAQEAREQMKAIILAAGLGTRLQPLTESRPKCLIELGGSSLLDYQVDAMRAVGVEEFVIVVGYEAEQVRAHCTEKLRPEHDRGHLRFVDNPDYEQTNSLYSLFLAREELDEEVFLLNCDIVFHPEIARRMSAADRPNVVAVDSRAPRSLEEMCVRLVADNRIDAISKQLDPFTSHGLSVQVARFCKAGARTLASEVARLGRDGGKALFPTSAFGPLIEAGQLFAVDAADLPWAEIDSIQDYEQAVERALPRMRLNLS